MPTPGAAGFDAAMTRAMGRNVTDWTEASVRCYGVEAHTTTSLWWRQPGGSGIYLGAAILDVATPDAQLFIDLRKALDAWVEKRLGLYDIWATRDLRALGMTKEWQTPWYLRPSGLGAPSRRALPTGLVIEVVETAEQLADFEKASRAGFEQSQPFVRFSQHAVESLAVPGMVYLNGRLSDTEDAGRVVSSVIVHDTGDMVGIYGLSTLPEFRRRGYARAMVRAVVERYPDMAVSVHPDPETVPIYTDIGFVPGGEVAFWGSSA